MAVARIAKFAAAPGAGFGDGDAQRYGEFLERIGLGTRLVEADEIVEAARPKSSPIHKHIFDRNQKEAAREYYVERARHLVRHIVVSAENTAGETLDTRAFHHIVQISDDGVERGYVSQRIVWQQPDYARLVLEKTRRELVTWRARLEQYEEFGSIVRAIDDVLGEVA